MILLCGKYHMDQYLLLLKQYYLLFTFTLHVPLFILFLGKNI